MNGMGSAKVAVLLLAVMMTGCASSEGINENLSVAAATTPVVGEVKAVRDEALDTLEEATFTAADAMLTVPFEILFYGLPPSQYAGQPAGFSPLLKPEERLARRRHAMGLPDNAERRVQARRLARRRQFELQSHQQ